MTPRRFFALLGVSALATAISLALVLLVLVVFVAEDHCAWILGIGGCLP